MAERPKDAMFKPTHRHIWMELGDKGSDSYIQMCQDCGFHGDSCKCARCKCRHDWQPYSRTDKKWLWCDKCHSVKMRPEYRQPLTTAREE